MLVLLCQPPFFALSNLAFSLSLFAGLNAAAALCVADLNGSTSFLGDFGGGFFLFMFLIIAANMSFLFVRLVSSLYLHLRFDAPQLPFVSAIMP